MTQENTGLPGSESLLTEILGLLQTLSANVDDFRPKLSAIEVEIQAIHGRINKVINEGFPDGNLTSHRRFHLKGALARLIARG